MCRISRGEVETRQGALARAQACHAAHEAARGTPADYAVGLEGGCLDEDLASAHPDVAGLGSSSFPSPSCFSSVVSCFAVLAVLKAGPSLQSPRWGIAKTATFALPNKIVKLMRGDPPIELGDADDKVFSDINSKQKGGTIGKVTKGLIDRTKYYEHALLCALAPFMHENWSAWGILYRHVSGCVLCAAPTCTNRVECGLSGPGYTTVFSIIYEPISASACTNIYG